MIRRTSPLRIDIVIGLDYYCHCLLGEVISLVRDPSCRDRYLSLSSVETKRSASGEKMNACNFVSRHFIVLSDISVIFFKNVWESWGPTQDTLLTEFRDRLKLRDSRYEVGLLWKPHQPKLAYNFTQAKSHLLQFKHKLDKSPQLKTAYEEVFEEMERIGVMKPVCQGQPTPADYAFYLPHCPVVREDSSSTKVRSFFYSPAVGPKGDSLNNCLEVGPCLMPHVVEVTRFRRWNLCLWQMFPKCSYKCHWETRTKMTINSSVVS